MDSAKEKSQTETQAQSVKKNQQKLFHVHERFAAKDEVVSIIHSLKEVYLHQIKTEKALERFTFLVDEYQEQPHLVDPHLEEIVSLILSKVCAKDCEHSHRSLLFTCLYLLTKMRGYKVIVRYLPHEASDVETVLDLLGEEDPSSCKNWQNKYCLVLWLSMVSMIPFDLSRLDSQDAQAKLPVMDRILQIGKTYLCVTDKSADAAAYMLARFLTRPDVKKRKLKEVLEWAISTLTAGAGGDASAYFMPNNVIASIMRMLATLCKTGAREDLIPYASRILHIVTHEPAIHLSHNIVIRKLGVKLIQRLGMTYLKSKVATWRYSRGRRSLAINLAKSPDVQQVSKPEAMDEDVDVDIPDEVEEVIEHLLTTLKDKDTIVRWSAAKGIGRVTDRLPRELADEIIESLLQLFTLQETDGAWHGGCLALAELGRRGLLLPQRLPEVIPVIKRSLNYDEKKGFCSIGAHVRDAACYVCWSFARAYEPDDFKDYANDIASALLILAVYDREVNVRRAASAAFQENVGRQGNFPHGIDIVTACDYFAVFFRAHAYLKLSKFVAGFPEYTKPLIDHLVEFKINHWASDIRVLAAEALGALVPLSADYFINTVLPHLLDLAIGPDLNYRHGAIYSIGQVCAALTADGQQVADHHITAIAEIEPTLRSRQLLLGLGGEYMRKALCSLVKELSGTELFKGHSVIETWQLLLDQCLTNVHLDITVQEAASEALPHFLSLRGCEGDDSKEKIVRSYIDSALSSTMEKSRIGSLISLGALPEPFLRHRLLTVLSALIRCSKKLSSLDKDWAESRREAVKSIQKVCSTVGTQAEGDANSCICRVNISEVNEAYLYGMLDYTVDSRGDVGAWVREACMEGMVSFTKSIAEQTPQLLSPDHVSRLCVMLAQQACEKIDRTRNVAGTALASLLHTEPEIPHIPCRGQLLHLFPRGEENQINYVSPSVTFPKFVELLDLEVYRYNVLLGFTVSVGGLTESLVKYSHAALLDYLQHPAKQERVGYVSDSIILIFKKNQKDDRVIIPLMKMTSQLLTGGIYDQLCTDTDFEFPLRLIEALKEEISRCGDPQKLLVAGEVFSGLLIFEETVRSKSLLQLCIFLCHKFPIVRKTTASNLYEALMANDLSYPEEVLDEMLAVLSDNEWDEPVEKLRPIRNNLCTQLGITPPVMKKKV